MQPCHRPIPGRARVLARPRALVPNSPRWAVACDAVDYSGRIVVVTGASSGLGRRLALDLAARGAVVVGIARHVDELAEAAAQLQAHTPASRTVVCDLRDTD